MKKLLVLTFVVFLLLAAPATAANIGTFSNPKAESTFNFGDQVILTGQIALEENVIGAQVSFVAKSMTLGQSIPITTKFYSFLEDTPTTFSQINRGTITWTVPNTAPQGTDWVLEVVVSKSGTTYLEFTSTAFSVTNQLTLIHSTSANLFNFGETLEFGGTVLDVHDFPIVGTATVQLNEASLGTVDSRSVTVDNGYVEYSYKFKETDPKGSYSVWIDVLDEDGNKVTATSTAVNVTSLLPLFCSLSASELKPGTGITLIGAVTDIHDQDLNNVELTGFVTDPSSKLSVQYETKSDANGAYAFDATLPSLSLPGVYAFRVEARDTAGNEGTCSQTFVVASEKSMAASITTNATWAYPDESVLLQATVQNKGNLDLAGDVDFYLNTQKIVSKPFSVARGQTISVSADWSGTSLLGNHTLSAKIVVDSAVLAEGAPQSFEVFARPVEKKGRFTTVHAILIMVILIITVIVYSQRNVLKEYLDQRSVEKHFGSESPNKKYESNF